MEIYVYTPELVNIGMVDTYQSFIWNDRYAKPGDFELFTPVTQDLLDWMIKDYYLSIPESNYTMIVEEREIKTDTEEGPIIRVAGRSLESILDRRIIWAQTSISGNLQNGVKKLITENLISPSDSNRAIPNFQFKDSTDPAITDLTYEAQYTGDNLLEVIEKICEEKKIGFRVWIDDNNIMQFELYAGIDRSYNQATNPYIIFSPEYENLINSSFVEKYDEEKNIALVAGEGQNQQRITRTVGSGTGLERKELYVDARDLRQEEGEAAQTYYNKLDTRGKEKLNDSKVIKEFDAECVTDEQFIYGEDFFLGDIVQVENEYGIGACARITEFITSDERDELKRYPTFEIIEEEEES